MMQRDQCLIVARTRMGQGDGEDRVCLGGVMLSAQRPVRLMISKRWNPAKWIPYKPGDVWELAWEPGEVEAPHTEDIYFMWSTGQRITQWTTHEIVDYVLTHQRVWREAGECFDGSLRWTQTGHGFVTRPRVPTYSTGFWMTGHALHQREDNGRRYYGWEVGGRWHEIRWVADAPQNQGPQVLPPGTLLRLSLARWWRQELGQEARCYLQLSGWFLSIDGQRGRESDSGATSRCGQASANAANTSP